MGRRALGHKDRQLLHGAADLVGIDEVGRGCLAGPVVVCGVAFSRIPRCAAIQDSKQLTPQQRDSAARWIVERCDRWLVTEVWVELIDRLNILEATRLAMAATARTLAGPATTVVVDQLDLGEVGRGVHASVGADAEFFCVAAASILAKVHRDCLMVRLGADFREFQWAFNKGYGTLDHRRALDGCGRSYLHRKSFGWSPVLP